MHAIASAFEFLSHWFADHMMWAILMASVVAGTIAITLRFDRD